MDTSIVVLVYNSEKTIRRCIDSLLSQTYKDFELIIVDDGSKDNSISIIESYADSRIKIIKNEKNLGIAKSRNVGLRNCHGNLIFFTDSDCIPMSNWLYEGVVNIGEKDIISGWTLYENPNPSFKDRVVQGRRDFFTCNLGFKKKALDKVRGFNEAFAMYTEDRDICLRIIKEGGKSVFCENMMVIHQRTLRKPRDELKRYVNYYQGKLLSQIKHGQEKGIISRIIRPDDLLKIFFPPLLLLTKSFKSREDFMILPFTWAGMFRGRVSMWKKAFKLRKFYL